MKPICKAGDALPYYQGSKVSGPKGGKHFLHLDDFSKDELLNIFELAKMAKAKFYARDETFKPFRGQSMAMIFTKPSARTRVSFETVRNLHTQCFLVPSHSQIPSL
jgi:ornithine carbamoyltransferase